MPVSFLFSALPILVRTIAYGLMLYALWTTTAEVRRDIGRQVWYRIGRRRLFARRVQTTRIRLPHAWHRHLRTLVEAARNRTATDRSVAVFVRISVVLAVGLAVAVFWSTTSAELSIVAALLGVFSPYLWLRYRLYKERLARANQIQILVQLLLSSYRVHSHNPYYALRDTVDQLRVQHSPLTKPVARLLATVQGMANDQDVLQGLESFVYSIQSGLAQQLGAILCTALVNKLPIEAQLRDLDHEITTIQQSLDEEKAERADNVGLGYLPILAFPAVELFLYWQSGTMFTKLQFSGAGTTYFVLALIGSIGALLIAIFSKRPKIDL